MITATPVGTLTGRYPLRIVYRAVPRAASNIVASQLSPYVSAGGESTATLRLSNNGVRAGWVDTYAWGLSDPRDLPSAVTATNDIRLNSASAALFGQLDWHVTDRFTVQPGARLNYDKKDGAYSSVVTDGAGNLVVRMAGLQPVSEAEQVHSVEELRYLVTASGVGYALRPDGEGGE